MMKDDVVKFPLFLYEMQTVFLIFPNNEVVTDAVFS